MYHAKGANAMKAKISIGMPVYNGAVFLNEAIDSLLDQTFEDFELVISDNASTDETRDICMHYAENDPRVRYYRNAENIGAARNYNRVFELSYGEYFKWAAHDDICGERFLQRCVETLEKDKNVVLCYPRTVIMDEVKGKTIKYDDGFNISSPTPYKRYKHYHKQIRGGHECHPVFGLIRSDVLGKTTLIKAYASSDLTLLGELALYGRFHEVPEYLFFKRNHVGTSIHSHRSLRSLAVWFDPANAGKLQLNKWIMFREYLRSIKRSPIDSWQKMLCRMQMGQWFFRHAGMLSRDILKAVMWPFVPRTMKTQCRKEVKKCV
jgi:glycosyltransferase involved in cell wall biosynthesis